MTNRGRAKGRTEIKETPQDLSAFEPLTGDELSNEVWEDDPGPELRRMAEQILWLQERHKSLPRCHDKYQVEKTIKRLGDEFSLRFNRYTTWDEYCWPDGLTVRFVRKTGGRKIYGRVLPVFSRQATPATGS